MAALSRVSNCRNNSDALFTMSAPEAKRAHVSIGYTDDAQVGERMWRLQREKSPKAEGEGEKEARKG